MSLDKAIKAGKEHRKPYRRSKAFDTSCRNHGSCNWCRDNRLHKHKRRFVFDIQDTHDPIDWIIDDVDR